MRVFIYPFGVKKGNCANNNNNETVDQDGRHRYYRPRNTIQCEKMCPAWFAAELHNKVVEIFQMHCTNRIT